jgi:hypothetical protein
MDLLNFLIEIHHYLFLILKKITIEKKKSELNSKRLLLNPIIKYLSLKCSILLLPTTCGFNFEKVNRFGENKNSEVNEKKMPGLGMMKNFQSLKSNIKEKEEQIEQVEQETYKVSDNNINLQSEKSDFTAKPLNKRDTIFQKDNFLCTYTQTNKHTHILTY